MTTLTATAKPTTVLVISLMTAHAFCWHRTFSHGPLLVAGGTSQILMCPLQWKFSLLIVIKLPVRPPVRIMAKRAFCPEHPLMHILCLVADSTAHLGVFESR